MTPVKQLVVRLTPHAALLHRVQTGDELLEVADLDCALRHLRQHQQPGIQTAGLQHLVGDHSHDVLKPLLVDRLAQLPQEPLHASHVDLAVTVHRLPAQSHLGSVEWPTPKRQLCIRFPLNRTSS